MKSTKKQIRGRQNLNASDLHYRHLFDSLREGIIFVDNTTGIIVDANTYFLSMVGFFRSEVVGGLSSNFEIFQDNQEQKVSLNSLKLNSQSYSLIAKDGIKIDTEITTSEFYLTETGYTVYCFKNVTKLTRKNEELSSRIKTLTKLTELQEQTNAVILNITEDLEVARNLLRAEKTKAEAIIASIADAVFACDVDGNIQLFNKSAENLTGIKSKVAIGTNYKEIFRVFNGNSGESYEDLTNNPTDKQGKSNLLYIVSPKGSKIFISISSAKIFLNPHNPIGYVVVFHDISKEQEIDKVKSEFVSIASHQLRTPLTTINWATENLISGSLGPLDSKQLNEVTEVHKASKRMVSLIDSFLNVSRLELGTIIVEPEKVDIKKAVKKSLKELEQNISDKKLSIKEKYGPKISTYNTDPKLLNIILINLLSNAVKYTPREGRVVISTVMRKDSLQITVTDTGIGIPENQQKLVFSKLFRANNAQEIDSTGTGLGLYIVKEIISSLNGKVSFSSKSGGGTTFKVLLPISKSSQVSDTKRLTYIG